MAFLNRPKPLTNLPPEIRPYEGRINRLDSLNKALVNAYFCGVGSLKGG